MLYEMSAILNIDSVQQWENCPVLLPFPPHTISSIVPGYLGILIPFILFDIIFFLWIHKLFMENSEHDHTVVKNIRSSSSLRRRMLAPSEDYPNYDSPLDPNPL